MISRADFALGGFFREQVPTISLAVAVRIAVFV